MTALRDDPRFAFEQVMDICGVDWPERPSGSMSSTTCCRCR
jgi:NADH:ubiquinone oxidoreductase subunit C